MKTFKEFTENHKYDNLTVEQIEQILAESPNEAGEIIYSDQGLDVSGINEFGRLFQRYKDIEGMNDSSGYTKVKYQKENWPHTCSIPSITNPRRMNNTIHKHK